MDTISRSRLEKRDASVAFFGGWKLWQQMCFVLACLIVLTLSAGLGRVWYNARRIRKYSRVATNAAQSPSELEAQKASISTELEKPLRLDGKQVPFGIRALEDGIEVEGVWVSRPNTPVPGSPASIASSHSGSYASSKCLSKPEPLRPLENFNLSDDILEQPQVPWTRRSFAGLSHHHSDPPTLTGAQSLPTPLHHGRRQCPTKVYSYPAARPSNLLMHHQTALDSLEGNTRCSMDITESGTQSEHYLNSPTSTEDSDDDLEKFELIHPAFRPPKRDRPVAADPRGDLNLLHSHRLSHVAETGELKPRSRRLASGDQWVPAADNVESPSEYTSLGGSGASTPQLFSLSNPFTTPRTSRSSSLSLQLASLDDTQHELATPPTSEMVSSQAVSDGADTDTNRGMSSPVMLHDPIESYYNRLQQMRQHHHEVSSPNEWGPPAPQTVLTGQNHQRLSQVLRKVNSQFEILRPGTLNALEERQRLAEQQNQQLQQRDKRNHRKLRKKRLSQGSVVSVDMGYT